MGSNKRHVNKEGFVLVTLSNVTTHLVGENVGLIALFFDRDTVALKILATLVAKGREVAHFGVQMTVEVFKATGIGMVSLQ